jgi:hypothetical protein
MISSIYSKCIGFLIIIFLINTSFHAIEINNNTPYLNDNRSIIYDSTNECIDLLYSFDTPIIKTIELNENSYYVIEIRNLTLNQDPGKPQLPVKNVNILLPPHTKVKDIMIQTNEQTIFLDHKIMPCGKPMTIGDTPSDNDIKYLNNLYTHLELYPKKQVEQIGMQKWKGFNILILRISPVQYNPNQDRIIYTKNIRLSIITEYEEQDHSHYRNIHEDKQTIINKIENPSILQSYEQIISDPIKNALEDEFKYIIITSDNLKPHFQPLIDYKNQYITAKSISLSYINSSFSGLDLQEKIRDCIQFYYQHHNTEFVLLGGDVDVVPYRGLWGEAIDHEGTLLHDNAIPSDLYYACLDGTWDLDNDGIYGESLLNSTGEEADFFAEVYVGRAPVNTNDEVEIFIHKVINYETSEKPKGVMLHQSSINIINYPDSSVIPEQCAQWIPSNYTVKKLYQKYGFVKERDWDNTFESNNYMIIEHTGNGVQDRYFLTWPEYIFYNTDCQVLRNQFYPIHTSVACDSGAFEYEDCLAENMLLNPYGGASSCLFNSRRGFTSNTDAHRYSGEIIEQQFYHIFQENIKHIGIVNQLSKESFSSQAIVDPAFRWCYYCLNLLGDPEMPLFNTRQSYYDQNVIYVDDDFNPSTPGWNKTHFNSIQTGIDAATPWDTVFVYNGLYKESISINKHLLLTGENNTNTILISSKKKPIISINEDYVILSYLNIKSLSENTSSKGVIFNNINWIKIFHCNIKNQSHGIFINNCSNFVIGNNIFTSNNKSIYINNSHIFQIVNNDIFDILSGGYGIFQKESRIYYIPNQTSYKSSISDYSTNQNSYQPLISDNTISTNLNATLNFSCGIYTEAELVYITSNQINNCTLGIWCKNTGLPIIQFNTIQNNSKAGIFSYQSHPWIFSNIIRYNGNNFNEDNYDIEPGGIIQKFGLKSPMLIWVTHNIISNNQGYGVYLHNCYDIKNLFLPSDSQAFYMNEIYDNTINAFFRNSTCHWGNNYWGDQNGKIYIIQGIHITEKGITSSGYQFDFHPSRFPLFYTTITNDITAIIRAGASHRTNPDHGFGYSIITRYNIERPISIHMITYWNGSNDISYNKTESIRLSPLYYESVFVYYTAPEYRFIRFFSIYQIEIIIKIEDKCLAKRSGIQIGPYIIFNR